MFEKQSTYDPDCMQAVLIHQATRQSPYSLFSIFFVEGLYWKSIISDIHGGSTLFLHQGSCVTFYRFYPGHMQSAQSAAAMEKNQFASSEWNNQQHQSSSYLFFCVTFFFAKTMFSTILRVLDHRETWIRHCVVVQGKMKCEIAL